MIRERCSITRYLEIDRASIDEYRQLGRFHYCGGRIGPYAAIYAIKDMHPGRVMFGGIVGVIVYTMGAANMEFRNAATGGMFCGFGDRRLGLGMVNKHIRCISRVIIEPRYRGLGLASWLVAETMPRVGVSIIEATAVMGKINPFFEKAGMKRFEGRGSARGVRLIEALGMVGIGEEEFIDAWAVQAKLDGLSEAEAEFIEGQIRGFLQPYGKRRDMVGGIERTRYVLGKLTMRGVYYIWFNPECETLGLIGRDAWSVVKDGHREHREKEK
jgi:GNAT superfamily N-acetyltransferase